MDWMTAFEGVMDIAKRTITLTTPEKKRIVSNQPSSLKGLRLILLRG
jgi:hypothetical protein